MTLAVRPAPGPMITVRRFFEHARKPLQLELAAGEDGMDRVLTAPRIQKPGLALAGYVRFVHDDRVQILGETELSYLDTLPPDLRRASLDTYLDRGVACVMVTKGLPLDPTLVTSFSDHSTPLFRTPLRSSECIRKTLTYLDDLLAPRCSVHGVLVDVNGVGVLLTGQSGIGKSETALDLVERGHRLVADDVVDIRRRGEDLVGQASSLIQHLIEVRGLGILNIAELFGVAATRLHKRIELHVELETWSPGGRYDRIGLEERSVDVLGVPVRSLLVPVSSGRNVAGIVEVAARNTLLQIRGHHAARDLNERIRAAGSPKPEGEPPAPEENETTLLRASELGATSDHIEDEVE